MPTDTLESSVFSFLRVNSSVFNTPIAVLRLLFHEIFKISLNF